MVALGWPAHFQRKLAQLNSFGVLGDDFGDDAESLGDHLQEVSIFRFGFRLRIAKRLFHIQ